MAMQQPTIDIKSAPPPSDNKKTSRTMGMTTAVSLIIISGVIGFAVGIVVAELFEGSRTDSNTENSNTERGAELSEPNQLSGQTRTDGEASITVTSPIEPEYCLSDDLVVSWSVDREFDYVSLSLRAPSGTVDLGDYRYNDIDGSIVPGFEGKQTIKLSEYITDPSFQEEKLFELIVGGHYEKKTPGLGLVGFYSDRFTIRRCSPTAQSNNTADPSAVTDPGDFLIGGDQDGTIRVIVDAFSDLVEDYADSNNSSYSGFEQCVSSPNVATCKSEFMVLGVQEVQNYLRGISGGQNNLVVFANENAYCVSHSLTTTQGHACANADPLGLVDAVITATPCTAALTTCAAGQF